MPGDPNLQSLMGVLHFSRGENARAEYYFSQAARGMPGNPEVHVNWATALLAQRKFREAIEPLRRAIELRPTDPEARVLMISALTHDLRLAEAVELGRECAARWPNDGVVLTRYAHSLLACGRVEEAVAQARRAAEVDPGKFWILDSLCMLLPYAPGVTSKELYDVHARFGELIEERMRTSPSRHERQTITDRRRAPNTPLRVGLLSPDLRRHSVASVIHSFLEHAPRDRVTLTAYSTTTAEDEISAELRGLLETRGEAWRSMPHFKGGPEDHAREVAERIRADGIDVLMDLSGHSAGHQLRVMALRPAPVAVTYAGWPGTTGLKSIGYRLSDSLTDPAGAEEWSTEEIVRLDPCSISYRPLGAPPALVNRTELEIGSSANPPIVFGCFGAVQKYNEPLLRSWCEILREVPDSRLVLKHVSLRDPTVRAALEQRVHGMMPNLEANRVDIRGPRDDWHRHLEDYLEIDISLDTAPYNGTITICESLLMGVPVISLRGDTTASRVGHSILMAVGLGELSAMHHQDYVRIATELAQDRPRLRKVREGLRERFLASCVCDERGHADRLTNSLCDIAAKLPS